MADNFQVKDANDDIITIRAVEIDGKMHQGVVLMDAEGNVITNFGGGGSNVKTRKLSESVNGQPIPVVQTASPGTLIHTSVVGTIVGTYDKVWLYAFNTHTADVVINIEFGDQTIIHTIPSKAGLMLVVPGLPLQNAVPVRVFAATTLVVKVVGYVELTTD